MYEGHPRLFCPHLLGRRSKADGTRSVISLEEASDSGLRTVSAGVGGWRCIVVEKLSQVELRSGGWHTEPRSRRQTCIDEVEFDADAQPGEDPQ